MLISHFFSTRLSEALKESRVIDGSDMLQYEYCLEYLFDIILYNSSLILIGGMLHDLPGAILYILCVSLMKSSAGGYHARDIQPEGSYLCSRSLHNCIIVSC